ncbi:unnamed protein product [Ostreobium quekettii]|uniref:Uncharacterized protein n=1 Tax=Ostreobium quekettii TaxID=121088 RepID=A0A8S1JIT6_9CHLO|nr:unnamed protein product [Ostreobium quekettii]
MSKCVRIWSLCPSRFAPNEPVLTRWAYRSYKMTGLKPGSTYELRVSYPATIPAAISFKIIPNAGGAEGALQRSSRRLLNVEKLPFHVELDATIEGIPAGHALVSVSASPAGVRPSAINRPPEEWLIFNIVLVNVVGGIPVDALPVMGTGVFLIVAVILFVRWWIKGPLDRILLWLMGDDYRRNR